MRTNKKTILISWFIGIGFGLFFSGIILSVLLYTSNKAYVSETINHSKTTEIAEMAKKSEVPDPIEDDTETKDVNIEKVELEIKSTSTAREITQMLVDHDVISDYDEFIAYIVSMDAERSLHHGNKVFPLNSDVETVFKILRSYK